MPDSISVEEYLRNPELEYIDGEIRERNWGDWPHSAMHGGLAFLLGKHEKLGRFRVLISLTIKISETRYRVADVCLIRRDAPYEEIPSVPPLLCVEVLSPEDGMLAMMEKVDDYLGMGVGMVWLIDPRRYKAYVADRSGYKEVKELPVPGTSALISVNEAFAELQWNRLDSDGAWRESRQGGIGYVRECRHNDCSRVFVAGEAEDALFAGDRHAAGLEDIDTSGGVLMDVNLSDARVALFVGPDGAAPEIA